MKTPLRILVAALAMAGSLHARTWTEAGSGRTLIGDLVRADAANALIRRADGSTVNIPLTKLSEADQAFVKDASMPKTAEAVDPKKEILGTWDGFMANSDGSPHGQIRLVITGNEITATNPQGGQVMGAGSYTISGSGKLCRIDAEGTSGQFAGKAYEGIFSVEGKTLKWCSANDNPRSTPAEELKTDPPAGQFLMVLEKQG